MTPKGTLHYCSCCMEPCEPVTLYQEIPDYHYGRGGVQRIPFVGSSCCGDPVLDYRGWVKRRWDDRCRLAEIGRRVDQINALTAEIKRYGRVA